LDTLHNRKKNAESDFLNGRRGGDGPSPQRSVVYTQLSLGAKKGNRSGRAQLLSVCSEEGRGGKKTYTHSVLAPTRSDPGNRFIKGKQSEVETQKFIPIRR